ncbi:MAG: radical SAM protein [Gemmataceae bacterium]|nr:radical SAM protein [Gemmataceae bacterium]MDW8264136.1 4Fe-4S single cluster domain-containing protein [Gemmataceae bacterium]
MTMSEVDPRGDMELSVALIVPCTEAEGPGRRWALWFQGCPLRCPGCCNPEMLSFAGGRRLPAAAAIAGFEQAQREHGIEGITLLGGEPLAQARGAAILARAARQRGLSVMVFTGYTLEQAQQLGDPAVAELLACTDILVDGPYRQDLPERQRRWIGSANQRVYFLTDRYRADDPCWRRPNTVEIRWRPGELTVNGFPVSTPMGPSRRR